MAIPALIRRLAENGGLQGALVSIDAIATNAAGAAYLPTPYLLMRKLSACIELKPVRRR